MLGGAAAGGAIGAALRRGVDRSTPLRVVDRLLGGALAVLAGALSLSLIASSVAATGTPGHLDGARIVAGAARDRRGDAPAGRRDPRRASASAVLDDGLPQLGVLLDLDVQPTAPPVALDDPELAAGGGIRRARLGRRVRVRHERDRLGVRDRARPRRDQRARRRGRGPPRSSNCRVSRRARDASCTSTPSTTSPSSPSTTSALRRSRSSLPLAPGTAAVVQGYPYGGPFTMVERRGDLGRARCSCPTSTATSSALRDIYALAAHGAARATRAAPC